MMPLNNKTILVCRAKMQLSEFADKLIKLGARVISMPTIEIQPVEDWTKVDETIYSLTKFDFIIFTSANAVKYFHLRCSQIASGNILNGIKVICVGDKTRSACDRLGINVNLVPKVFSSEGLIQEFRDQLAGKKILYPHSSIGKDDIINQLKLIRTDITVLDIYKTTAPSISQVNEEISMINKFAIDIFIFTSPSTFENFLKLLNIGNAHNYFEGKTVAAIGPTTEIIIREKNVKVSIVPQIHTTDGLVQALADYFSNKN